MGTYLHTYIRPPRQCSRGSPVSFPPSRLPLSLCISRFFHQPWQPGSLAAWHAWIPFSRFSLLLSFPAPLPLALALPYRSRTSGTYVAGTSMIATITVMECPFPLRRQPTKTPPPSFPPALEARARPLTQNSVPFSAFWNMEIKIPTAPVLVACVGPPPLLPAHEHRVQCASTFPSSTMYVLYDKPPCALPCAWVCLGAKHPQTFVSALGLGVAPRQAQAGSGRARQGEAEPRPLARHSSEPVVPVASCELAHQMAAAFLAPCARVGFNR